MRSSGVIKKNINDKYFKFISQFDNLEKNILAELPFLSVSNDFFDGDKRKIAKYICNCFSIIRCKIIEEQLNMQSQFDEKNMRFHYDEEFPKEKFSEYLQDMNNFSLDYTVFDNYTLGSIVDVCNMLTYVEDYSFVAEVFNQFNDILSQISVRIRPLNGTRDFFVTLENGEKDIYNMQILYGSENVPKYYANQKTNS